MISSFLELIPIALFHFHIWVTCGCSIIRVYFRHHAQVFSWNYVPCPRNLPSFRFYEVKLLLCLETIRYKTRHLELATNSQNKVWTFWRQTATMNGSKTSKIPRSRMDSLFIRCPLFFIQQRPRLSTKRLYLPHIRDIESHIFPSQDKTVPCIAGAVVSCSIDRWSLSFSTCRAAICSCIDSILAFLRSWNLFMAARLSSRRRCSFSLVVRCLNDSRGFRFSAIPMGNASCPNFSSTTLRKAAQ